jgi:hypothetical protein
MQGEQIGKARTLAAQLDESIAGPDKGGDWKRGFGPEPTYGEDIMGISNEPHGRRVPEHEPKEAKQTGPKKMTIENEEQMAASFAKHLRNTTLKVEISGSGGFSGSRGPLQPPPPRPGS